MAEPKEPLTRKERLNRNIIIASGFLGGLIAVPLFFGNGGISNIDKALNGPLPKWLALLALALWVVVLPIAIYWHRIIDEQEASAYRDGGYYSAYTLLILTPIWWVLWRGGMAPEPNAMICVAVLAIIWTTVWFWKKYR